MQTFKTVGEKILKSTPIGVRVEGVDVVMTIGKANVIFPYKLALKLSVFLRHAGREAKRAAGDGGMIITPFADLTPQNADELNADMSVDRKRISVRK